MTKKMIMALLFCFMLIIPVTVTLVRAAPTLTLTAGSADNVMAFNNVYDVYSTVTLTGSMFYNQYTSSLYPNDGLVGVEVQNASGTPMVIRAISTGGTTPNSVDEYIDTAYLCDEGGNKQTSVPLPTADNEVNPYYYVHVINNENSLVSMLVTVNIFDSNGVPIPLSYSTLQIGAFLSSYVKLPFLIPSWAHYGTAYAYVNVFSDWPINGGIPLGPEQTFQFTITGGTPFQGTPPTTNSLNGLDQYFNFTFRLPKNSATGTYTAYYSANYNGTAASQTTSFSVALLGDLNGDGRVNFNDVTLFVSDYLSYFSPSHTYFAAIDFSDSGKINFKDVTSFVNYYLIYWSS